jgi:hypothetical protein
VTVPARTKRKTVIEKALQQAGIEDGRSSAARAGRAVRARDRREVGAAAAALKSAEEIG